MEKKTYEMAKSLENEIAGLELEAEAYRGILARLAGGFGRIAVGDCKFPIDDELLPVIQEHYEKKLENRIARIKRLRKEFEEL